MLDGFTISQTITLTLSFTGNPTHYKASENEDFSGASWIAYTANPDFILFYGYGLKTVYVKVKDVNDYESEILSESIRYANLSSPFQSDELVVNRDDDENTAIMCVRQANLSGRCGNGVIDGTSNYIQDDNENLGVPFAGNGCSDGIDGVYCGICSDACPFSAVKNRITRTEKKVTNMSSEYKTKIAEMIAGTSNEETARSGGMTMLDIIDQNACVDGSVYEVNDWALKALIKTVIVVTTSTDWEFYIYQKDGSALKLDVPMIGNGDGRFNIDMPWENQDTTPEDTIYFKFVDNSGSLTADIEIRALELS